MTAYGNNVVPDFKRVEGIEGMHFASQVDPQTMQVQSLITYDMGGKWERINVPADSDCILDEPPCSLHVHLQSSTDLRIPSLLTQKSAPGFVMANGNVGQVRPPRDRCHAGGW